MDENFLTNFGSTVKALSGNRVTGRVVTFSGPRDPDRVNDFFTQETDFWLNGPNERRPVIYHHGLDPTLKRRRFGNVELSLAADGVWAEGSIQADDPDARKLHELAEQGALRWSTGSVAHLVVKSLRGGANHIDEWPIAECSLTPASLATEPRCIASLKSLVVADTFADLVRRPSPQQQAINAKALLSIRRFERLQRDFERSV